MERPNDSEVVTEIIKTQPQQTHPRPLPWREGSFSPLDYAITEKYD